MAEYAIANAKRTSDFFHAIMSAPWCQYVRRQQRFCRGNKRAILAASNRSCARGLLCHKFVTTLRSHIIPCCNSQWNPGRTLGGEKAQTHDGGFKFGHFAAKSFADKLRGWLYSLCFARALSGENSGSKGGRQWLSQAVRIRR